MALLVQYKVFFVDWEETSRSIGLMSLTGRNLPAYCTANGKVLLAHLDSMKLDEFFCHAKLKSYTPTTITDRRKLRQHLDETRKNGYATDNAEFQADVMGIASPVRDPNGNVVASISVAAPLYRINNEKTMEEMVKTVNKTAERISRRMGHVNESHPSKCSS